ncbi:hypothetical protein GCM10011376_18050 [Nocardioides flavus (ex Wang et al. 2016)]|uniref:DUF3352 domain-containing protein n=1 Tax=Nocardioides flavus (ex Wang et al. 2016) TaxID=2058780 RepID=A0ABQ3HHR1_9ACTN|nr:DUF3352 domain-containing protein [Nocardioides flavus (ex Wang et al. 2016)]GHE17195.1 hypothetical protein GCM10011376_18050 [Nocardioides flavus (ex Wang et al. 2016)]
MSMTPGGPTNGPEYLDGPGPADMAPADSGVPADDTRKRLIALGAVVAGGAVIAGGAWAATSFFATGAQPAEALPASTVGYLSVDLDPSGGQKIEAIQTLRKFPGLREEMDLQADDDLRERLFEEVLKSSACEGIDFADDIEPWLGSRAAFAAVDLGDDEPAPVGVIQVSDAGQAEDGVSKLVETCGAETDGDAGGWVVDGDWMVVAETEEIAQQVVDAAEGSTLAADSSFQRWTGEAGDDGFMSMYVAKGVTKYVEDLGGMGLMGLPGASLGMTPDAAGSAAFDEECLEEATTAEEIDACFSATDDTSSDPGAEEVPEELQQMINDFDGAAATVRFDDGAVEVEYAMSNYNSDMTRFMDSAEGVDMLAGLPDDTVAAFGFALEEGWAEAMLDYVKTLAPDEAATIDEQLAQFETETGLAFPEDVETLLGDGVTVSMGGGLDPDAVANGGPEEVPAGIRIKGDADEIQAVLDKISAQAGPEAAEFLQVTEGDGFAVLALQDDYRGALESSGSLGDSSAYSEVVEDDEAQSVLYVDFNADDDWLVRLTGDSPDVSENLEPLGAFGVSGWVDDEVVHGLVKLTTD